MPRALSDKERAKIVALFPTGKSCRAIGKETGHGHTTVSRIARDVGHEWGRTNLARACKARHAYSAEARAEFASSLFEELQHLMGRLRGPYTVWAFAGKDGLFGSEKLDEPDARALKDFWSSIGIGVKTVLDIDRHDSDGGLGLAAVDEWLQTVRGGKPK